MGNFVLFSRAWCVAEIATAFDFGAHQTLKLYSKACLRAKEKDLRHLRIESMEASRPEDIVEILANIKDTNVFNTRLQDMLFEHIIVNWRRFDLTDKLKEVGRTISGESLDLGESLFRSSGASGSSMDE